MAPPESRSSSSKSVPEKSRRANTRTKRGRIDLNLMLVLLRLIEVRNVSQVASELYVTQPAISNALARLRDLVGDPLLIKTKRGMEPTERALELVQPLRGALGKIQRAVEAARPFDPATTEADIVISADEYCVQLFVPAIAQRLRVLAPGLVLRVARLNRPGDVGHPMPSTQHFVLATEHSDFAEMKSLLLVEESWLMLARHGHSGLRGPLTLATYAALPAVVPWVAPVTASSWLDRILSKHGLQRRVAVRIATPAPLVTPSVDLVMTVPASLARRYAQDHGVNTHTLPPEFVQASPPYRALLHWHPESEESPLLRWTRERIIEVCAELTQTSRRMSVVPRAA
jgi:DNA-binding transcriptional LysR family regulator